MMLRSTLATLSLCFSMASAKADSVKLTFDSLASSDTYGQVTLDLPFDVEIKALDLKKVFALYVGKSVGESVGDGPSITGRYALTQGNLVFTPKYPPEPGMSYTAIFNASLFSKQVGQNHSAFKQPLYQLTRFIEPEQPYTAGEVLKVYPQADILPQNVLRFYVYFSQPMSFDNPYQYLSIINQNNEVVSDAFVEFREGLWDENRMRLTVFIHPGRIKRGVGPNVKQGPVFQPHQHYQLKVDKTFKDLAGTKLKQDFYKPFTITAPQYQKLDPKSWQFKLPAINSLQNLVIHPTRLLDPVLTQRMVTMVNSQTGAMVPADIQLSVVGDKLLIEPELPWSAGDYRIQFDSKLEDLSGNTPAWAFDSETPIKPVSGSASEYSISFSL